MTENLNNKRSIKYHCAQSQFRFQENSESIMAFLILLLLVLYILFDVNYFIRNIALLITGCLRWKNLRRPILEPDVTAGRCMLSDLDYMLHMNNAKYLQAFEIGRAAFGLKNKLWAKARKQNAHFLISAQVVRYRRPVSLFQAFEIHTKLVYWQDKEIYIQQELITLKDNFIRATCMVKMTLVNGRLADLLASLAVDASAQPLTLPPEVQHFIDYNRANSDRLAAERDRLLTATRSQ